MPPYLSRYHVLVRQEDSEAALEHVRRATNRVARVTIIRTLAVKAQIVCGTDEKRFQYVTVRHLVDLGRHVNQTSRDRHAPAKTQ